MTQPSRSTPPRQDRRGFGKLQADIDKAGDAMERALERAFPNGTRVRCWIMCGQVNPSTGEVIGHSRDRATVRVRLNSRKQDVRDVPIKEIL